MPLFAHQQVVEQLRFLPNGGKAVGSGPFHRSLTVLILVERERSHITV